LLDNPLSILLAREGPLTAPEAAVRLDVTPMTINNRAKAAGSRMLILGRGKNTRYALPNAALTGQSQWPLYWVNQDGDVREFAIASYAQPNVLHVYGSGINSQTDGEVPWFLLPLTLRGYLGRAARTRLGAVAQNWDTHPEQWPFQQQIFSAQSGALEHAGAILWGDESVSAWQASTQQAPYQDNVAALVKTYDELASTTSVGRFPGSSADGEQPKFSTRVVDIDGEVREVLVKFSPQHNTPFGDRWHDLLFAEAIASNVLRDFQFDVPNTRILSSATRTYLESARIDRVGSKGRRHLLPLKAAHSAFTHGSERHWADTVAKLVAQKRIAHDALTTTQTLFAFGKLIGNTDMHFGNLGMIVESPELIAKGRFVLAPCYDMLPMRFKPEAHNDFGYTNFDTELSATLPHSVGSVAKTMANEFWRRVSNEAQVSANWREFALGQVTR
jgi:HipA-like C-terminal domain